MTLEAGMLNRGTPVATKSWKIQGRWIGSYSFRSNWSPVDTLTLAQEDWFWTSGLCNYKDIYFYCFRHQLCVDLSQKSQATSTVRFCYSTNDEKKSVFRVCRLLSRYMVCKSLSKWWLMPIYLLIAVRMGVVALLWAWHIVVARCILKYVGGTGWVSLLNSKVSWEGTRTFSLGDSRSSWIGVLFCTGVSQKPKKINTGKRVWVRYSLDKDYSIRRYWK